MRLRFVALALALAVHPIYCGETAPPKRVEIPAPVKAELEKSLGALISEIDSLRADLKGKPQLLELLPDVQIFANAVRFALEDNEFYANKNGKITEFDNAKKLLTLGMERAKNLRDGKTPWTTQTGPVVRGYASKLDGTAIPYGLMVPAAYKAGETTGRRVDYWFMGRDANNTEIKFISARLGAKGDFNADGAFELHPFGRLCNAYKFAGEMDALEALDHVRAHYPVDDNKVAVRGFSMGGAATWHISSHMAGRWAAANPGAGFVDVANYQKIAKDDPKFPWYERKLWHLYDSVDYAINLTNTTLVAYSGEIDGQKAAADLMERTLADQGVKMTHIIGPKTGHAYEPNAKKEVAKLVDAATNKGRNPLPKEIRFNTFTLKYNTMHWVTIDALEKHWERASVHAKTGVNELTVDTSNISALTLTIPTQGVKIDGQSIPAPAGAAVSLLRNNGKWALEKLPETGLRKRHDLQGPIDDAFMSSFIVVKATGAPLSEKIGKWTAAEQDYALKTWRKQMRGEPHVKNDADISNADIAASNLVLFGDPSSNKILAKIIAQLPLKWTAQSVTVGTKSFPAAECAPVMIFPNPLNPKKYIVLNSGFTFAEFAASSNSQQTPKLPDWAVLDMSVPIKDRLKSGVKDAAFFNEKWEYIDDRK